MNKTTTGPAARCPLCEQATYLEVSNGKFYFARHGQLLGACEGSYTEPSKNAAVGGIDEV
jgi:hypothetical protein